MIAATLVFAALVPTLATQVQKETGQDSINHTETNWQVGGADLGILWDSGHGWVYSIYGDTFCCGGVSGDHRSNVLAFSTDNALGDGMNLSGLLADGVVERYIRGRIFTYPHLGQAIPVPQNAPHNFPDAGPIPSAAIAVGDTQYVHYMGMQPGGTQGADCKDGYYGVVDCKNFYRTYYSGIASMDGYFNTFDVNNGISWGPDSNFGMGAFYRENGWVYLYGTRPGRISGVRLARVPENQILIQSAWQYWAGNGWVSSEINAVDIVPDKVGEMSVQYNSYFNRYIMTYYETFARGNEDLHGLADLHGRDAIMMRDAPTVTGPWTGAKILAVGTSYGLPGATPYAAPYGSYIHPWTNASTDLYFVMSQYFPIYNTFVMHSTLSNTGTENMLSDPGFEDQVSGTPIAPWTVIGSFSGIDRGVGYAHTGQNNGWLRASDNATHTMTQKIALQPYTNYQAKVWVRTSPSLPSGMLSVRGPSGGAIASAPINSVIASFPGGQIVTVNFATGRNNDLTFNVGFTGNGSDNWIQIDDASVIQQ